MNATRNAGAATIVDDTEVEVPAVKQQAPNPPEPPTEPRNEVWLKKPIKAGQITKLVLRELTAMDMIEMRVSPIVFVNIGDNSKTTLQNKRADQRIEIDYNIAMGYLSKLTGVDLVTLNGLKGTDFSRAVNKVCDMWNEAEGE